MNKTKQSTKQKSQSKDNKIVLKNPYNLKTKIKILLDNDNIDKIILFLIENKIDFFYDTTNLLEKLYIFKQPINYTLVKYNSSTKSSKSKKKSINKNTKKSKKHKKHMNKKKNLDINKLNNIKKMKSYHYKELNYIQDLSNISFKVKKNLLDSLPDKNLPKSVKQVSEEYARGVAKYALINYKLPNKTSNAYMKLWEIYTLVPNLLQRRKQLNVFHLAEAPGQWINCTRHFIETKRPQIHHYNWIANSLNPKNKENINKYGKGIFGDDYGFIAKYPQKWLFGEDGTGDITKSDNVRWFRDYMKRFVSKGGQPIHLITGDAGMSGDNIDYIDLQKLEYAQLCMVAATSSIGSNCVIKHFLHLINYYPQSYEGSGFIVSFIYVYYLMFEEVRLIKPHTSSPNSREFYLVGLRFRGINDDIFNKMMKILDTFEENNCFFKKDDIPESFSNQVIQFMTDLFTQNNEHYDIQNMLLTCLVNPEPAIEKKTKCKKYLDEKFIREIQSKRYKEWIKKYKFE